MIRILYFIFSFLTVVMAPLADAENKVRAELISSTQEVVPGTTVWLGLSLDIDSDWNTYWKNAGATGLPPNIVLSDGADKIEPNLQFPLPRSKLFGDDLSLLTYGYVNSVVHPFQIKVPTNASKTWNLAGDATWLVCKDICIPETQSVSLSLSVVSNDQEIKLSADSNIINTARGLVPTDYPARGNFSGSNTLWIENLQGNTISDVMPEKSGEILGLVQKVSWLDGGVFVTMDRALLPEDFLSTYLIVAIDGSGIRIPLDRDLEAPKVAPHSRVSLIFILLMALTGGLILNLMPCVFPVLSIKSLSIASKITKDRVQIQKSAWLYTAGILCTMFVLAGLMVTLRAAGSQVGWGFQLQAPWFVALLIYIFVVMSLWLYGFIEVGGAFFGIGQELTEEGSDRAEFFTGVLAVIVATPCTAPFMGVAMGYTLTQPWWITVLVFSALGFGLALPMLSFVAFPRLVSGLPRPGAWMTRLKQFLAFPILATAIWLVWILVRQTNLDALVMILAGCLMLVFGFWLRRDTSAFLRAFGIISLLVSLAIVPIISQISSSKSDNVSKKVRSEPYTSIALTGHLAKGRSVFINMTADWCITCKVTEQRLLTTEDVERLFEHQNVIRMTGDWTRYDPTITKYLNRFARVGVPLYVVNHPDQEPIVLSQFPTYRELEDAILKSVP